MLTALVVMVVMVVPVTLPQEWGRLRVIEVRQDARGHFLELEYLDDTQAGVESVAVECWTVDSRGSPLVTTRKRLDAPRNGQPVRVSVYIRDRQAWAERVECQLSMGKPKSGAYSVEP